MRKIALVSSTRAEYGVMSRLIALLSVDVDIEFQLIVTGTHLSDKFGKTINEIDVPIYTTVDIEIEKNPSEAFGICVQKFDILFKENTPDILVLLGDRYEILAVAIAAMFQNICIAHISGGDTTEGAIDEAIRHSITKMSHIHFTSCETYRQRVIQLGENPNNVYNVGSLGVENIHSIKLLSKTELEKSLDYQLTSDKIFLVTFHPVTLEKHAVTQQMTELLDALSSLENVQIIFTMPNSDEGNSKIFSMIENFVVTNKNSKAFTSLGLIRYLSMIKYSYAVIGNSSSGILEVPSFNVPTINIGDRQKGRIQADSIINCLPVKDDILKAIKSINTPIVQEKIRLAKNPYHKENTVLNIIQILKNTDISTILKKQFYTYSSS